MGIPMVADRVAQMVVKQHLEPGLTEIFDQDSWILDLDIKSFFDTTDHGLLMRALRKHCQDGWVLLYVERGLTAAV